jgi:hypothetical protein
VVRALRDETINGEVHTFVLCEPTGDVGSFGPGPGDEYSGTRSPERGTYEPAVVPIDELASIGILPEWLVDVLPTWL